MINNIMLVNHFQPPTINELMYNLQNIMNTLKIFSTKNKNIRFVSDSVKININKLTKSVTLYFSKASSQKYISTKKKLTQHSLSLKFKLKILCSLC